MTGAGIRVNKIAVNVNTKENITDITLYKNNTALGFIAEDQLGIPSYEDSGVSLNAYKLYCKDIVENLLRNGGVPGYYYEPKEENPDKADGGLKYDVSTFRTKCGEYIKKILGDNYVFTMTSEDNKIDIEQYKDMYIKNARIDFGITVKPSALIEPSYTLSIMVCGEIKSGQMCRPRTMIHNGQEMPFNITNIKKLFKAEIPSALWKILS